MITLLAVILMCIIAYAMYSEGCNENNESEDDNPVMDKRS